MNTTATQYRVSRVDASSNRAGTIHIPEHSFRIADEDTVNQVRAEMRADIEPGSSDWIVVRQIKTN